MIVLLIVVILILSAMNDWAEAKDWEASEYNAELRHEELLDACRKPIDTSSIVRTKEPEETECNRNRVKKATRRRIAKDSDGRMLAEEIIIEGTFNYEY